MTSTFSSVSLFVIFATTAALVTCGAADSGIHGDEMGLLQTEVERRSSGTKAPVKAGPGGVPTCEAASGKCSAQWATQAEELVVPAALEVKAETRDSGVLGYILQLMTLAIVADSMRKLHAQRKEKAQQPTEVAKKGSRPAGDFDDLMKAALAGNSALCKELIDAGTETSGSDMWGCTLLHAAARGGLLPVTKMLLASGARVADLDAWDETPLHLAARAGHIDVCELLLAYGAMVDTKNAQEWTPLVVAADAGQEAVCSFLLGRGAGVAGLEDSALPALLVAKLSENMFEGGFACSDNDAPLGETTEEGCWDDDE